MGRDVAERQDALVAAAAAEAEAAKLRGKLASARQGAAATANPLDLNPKLQRVKRVAWRWPDCRRYDAAWQPSAAAT